MFCDGRPDPTRTDISAVGGGTTSENNIELAAVNNLKNSIPSPLPSGNCYKGYYCPDPTGAFGSATPKLKMAEPGYFTLEKSNKQFECLNTITDAVVNPLNFNSNPATPGTGLFIYPANDQQPPNQEWCAYNDCLPVGVTTSKTSGRY
jgi:hypothetical protein